MTFNIRAKLFVLLVMALAGFLSLTILGSFSLRNALETERSQGVQGQVETAMSIAKSYADRAARGDMTREDAEAAAKAAIGDVRYGDNEYFFVVDTNHIGLVHPNPDIIGRDLSSVRDENGVVLFQELVRNARAGGGFTAYAWPRANSDIPLDKVSYSALFEPWGWVIATGVYLDDLDALVSNEIKSGFVVDLLCFAALLIGIFWVSRMIVNPVTQLKSAVRRIGGGDLETRVVKSSNDEIGEISDELEKLRLILAEKSEIERQARADEQETQRVVRTLATELNALSNGDLRCRIDNAFAGSYEELRKDFNNAIENLRDIFVAVDSASRSVTDNAVALTSNTNALAQDVERNAQSLDVAASTLEQLSTTVKQTAAVAATANQLVENAKSTAKDGEQMIARTGAAIERIKTSSSEISSVTAVIEDIAFQTNLLALNAGVEAARAGEAGRGFSIVAQEVRGLAVRCREAVSTINGLVEQANTQVEDGATEFSQTEAALAKIIEAFNEIGARVSDINTSNQTQASGISNVSSAIGELRSSIQQNAAALEENSAGTTELQNEAEQLLKRLETLTIGMETKRANIHHRAA